MTLVVTSVHMLPIHALGSVFVVGGTCYLRGLEERDVDVLKFG